MITQIHTMLDRKFNTRDLFSFRLQSVRHNSNMSNKMDPRVDSDLDHRNDPTSNVGGRGNIQTEGYGAGAGYGGTSTGYGTAPTSNTGNTMHSSKLANKADPRVDSDFDHRANPASGVGGYGTSQTTSGYGGQHGSGAAGGTGMTGTGNTMHSSNLANKLDPRVDSDRDHRANPASNVGGYGNSQTVSGHGQGAGVTPAMGTGNTMHSSHTPAGGVGGYETSQASGYGQQGHGATGIGHNTASGAAGGYGTTETAGYGRQGHGAAGVHDTVTTGGAGHGGHHTGGVTSNTGFTGTSSSSTAGAAGHSGTSTHPPHNSDLLNKVDPRVKVDKDGRPL